jgi:hypothetical protein
MLYAIVTSASFFYFNPKFALDSTFIKEIQTPNKENKDLTDKEDQRLYKQDFSNSTDNTSISPRESILIKAEDVIRRFMEVHNVKLLDLYMDREGTLYVDFSNDLTKNFHGDAYEEYLLISGLYKTISRNIPEFSTLKILVDGKEINSIGGHIDISKPIGKMIEAISGGTVEGTI